MSDVRISRRSLLKGALLTVAAVPAASLLSRQALAANPLVDPNDAQAKSQHCANCIQYTGKAGDAEGGCNLFPGKNVKAAGWCKVWVLKPGASLG